MFSASNQYRRLAAMLFGAVFVLPAANGIATGNPARLENGSVPTAHQAVGSSQFSPLTGQDAIKRESVKGGEGQDTAIVNLKGVLNGKPVDQIDLYPFDPRKNEYSVPE